MRLLVLFLILALLPLPAFAEGPLLFRDAVKGPREEAALAMLESAKVFIKDLPYTVAAVDLNNDGVDEWIFRQDRESGCETSADCVYHVVGLSKNKPILIGDVTARKIGIAPEKSYGVNRLMAYSNKDNDYAYTVLGWSPQKGGFHPF